MKNTRSNTHLKLGETESEIFQEIISESSTSVNTTNILNMDDLGKTRNSAGHTNKEIYNIDPPLSEGRGTQNQQEVHNNVQNLTIDKLLQRMELMMKVHIETMTSIQNSIKIQADNMLSLREKLDSKENLKKEKDESPSISQLPVNEDLEENATKETSQTIISYVNSVNEVKNKESKEESESDEIEISSKRNRGTPKGSVKRKPGKPKESTPRKKDTTDKKLFQKYADLFGQIFKICNSNNLLLNIHKSKFFHAELKYLAYTLNRNSYTQSLQCVAKLIRKATSTMTTFLDSLIECKVNWIEPLISTIYDNKFKVGDYFKKNDSNSSELCKVNWIDYRKIPESQNPGGAVMFPKKKTNST